MTRRESLVKLLAAPLDHPHQIRIGKRVCCDQTSGERWDRSDGREKLDKPKPALRRVS